MSKLFDIYSRLPTMLQHVVCSAKGMKVKRRRYDAGFHRILEQYLRQKELAGAELEAYKAQRLQAHLQAARKSDFWRQRFERYGVEPAGNDPFEELSKLPILSKETARAQAESIRCDVATEPVFSVQTGGTTGGGLKFWETQSAEHERWAVWWRYRIEHGIEFDTWCGYFGGTAMMSATADSPPYWRLDWPGRRLMFDPNHLNSQTAASYARTLQKYGVSWIHGYPTIVAEMARWISRENLGPFPNVRIVTTGAENLREADRKLISEAFDAQVVDHYGLAESVANLSQLDGQGYAVDEDFSFVEFVPVEGFGELFHIVGTNWTNPAFPLLRYDTGDVATLAEDSPKRPEKNWSRRVERIDGRTTDFIRLPDGSRGGPFNHIFKKARNIRMAQVYQPDVSRVEFRVVREPAYSEPQDTDALLTQARARLGDAIAIDVVFVDELERQPNGKIRLVLSDIE